MKNVKDNFYKKKYIHYKIVKNSIYIIIIIYAEEKVKCKSPSFIFHIS